MAKLPKAKFNLKAPNAKQETLIFLVFRYRGKRVLYSTGFSIHPKDWDFKSQRPIEQEGRPDLWTIRRLLNDLSAYCTQIYIDSDYGVITVPAFKEKLGQLSGKLEPEQPLEIPTLFEFIEMELEAMELAKMKANSYKVYKLHAEKLRQFAKHRGQFNYEDVDWNLRLELIDWLSREKVQLTYGNKTLSLLRQFMERARRKDYHSNVKYQGTGWQVAQKKATGHKVTLNPDELQTLADLELTPFLTKVRDVFLIGVGTGQRFSDYSRLKEENFYRTIDNVPILSLISQKTETPAKIPLNIFPWLLPILEKYEFQVPKLSMQKLNENIKLICKEAGIDQKILKVEQYMDRKARVEKQYIPKYEAIASHTCRRSFATNLYRMGYQLGQIMPMTGHSTESQLRAYIGIDAEENAVEIAKSIQSRT